MHATTHDPVTDTLDERGARSDPPADANVAHPHCPNKDGKPPYRRIASPLKWHGGKSYLATKIVELMPPHRTYLEPYAGGLSVLLAKDPDNTSEIVNDLNRHLSNFHSVLADQERFPAFHRIVKNILFSEVAWEESRGSLDKPCDDSVKRAVDFFVCCRQSLAGRMDSFAPITQRRLRRRMNEQASAWCSAVDGLPLVHERFRGVVVLNQEATAVLTKYDDSDVVAYLDPPYPPESRVSPEVYEHEMTLQQHEELLDVVQACKAKILLSSYPNDLYEQRLKNNKEWHQHTFDVPNHASGLRKKERKQEVVWTNF
ncbi:MAG: DNA adenine methylase [Planctomycetia bacterium]|nr:DNA adenine methylase [Planctomycetia bacterium]